MKDTIFREYDIRGKIDSEFLIPQVYDLTRAIITYFKKHNAKIKTVALARDGRLSSPQINVAMIDALRDSGLDVIDIGVCPSPVLYFSLYELPVDAGLMITASHNPKDYNGIKIMLGTKSVWGKEIKKIRDIYKSGQFTPIAAQQGVVTQYPLIPTYVMWLRNHFPSLVGMNLQVVIDCGNAVGGTVLPDLITTMSWKRVKLLYPEVDGNYPNHEADPTVEKNMLDVKKALIVDRGDLGIGLDGDCDRMAAMTQAGFLVPGDQLLALFAQSIITQHPGLKVVCDIKASMALLELLDEWGAQAIMAPCGHAIIKDFMNAHKAILGGELSCHFFFADRHFGFDDGIYAMLRLFELIIQSGKSLEELLAIVPKKWSSPEIRIECAEDKKVVILEHLKKVFEKRNDVKMITVDGIRVAFAYGWAIVRASNTQPVLSMRFEANSEQDLAIVKDKFIQLLSSYFDHSLLEKAIR